MFGSFLDGDWTRDHGCMVTMVKSELNWVGQSISVDYKMVHGLD